MQIPTCVRGRPALSQTSSNKVPSLCTFNRGDGKCKMSHQSVFVCRWVQSASCYIRQEADLHHARERGGEQRDGVPRHPVPPARRHPALQPISGELWGHVTRAGLWLVTWPSCTSVQRITTTLITPHTSPSTWASWYLTNQRSVSCCHGPIRDQYWGSARVRW